MDKQSKEKRHTKAEPIRLKLSRQTSIDGETYYRANVQHRRTVDAQDLTNRIVAKRSELRPETLLNAYSCFKEEIYEALQNGDCVDLGLGMLSLRVKGKFENLSDRFDAERHTFNVIFTPSPRMQQLEKSLKANNKQTTATDCHPAIHEVNSDDPKKQPDGYLYAHVRAGSQWVHITGKNLKIMGNHPDTGIRFMAADRQTVIEPQLLALNERCHLLAYLGQPLTAGTWTVELATQFNLSYRLYKTPRHIAFTFEVTDDTAL